MKIKIDPRTSNAVLTYQERGADDTVQEVMRVFMGHPGDYVREKVGDDYKQVCKELERTGPTLAVGNNETLIDVIRREFKSMQRADAKSDCPLLIPAGRPRRLPGGKTVSMYLDASSLAAAESLGEGNISAGVRLALVPHLNAAIADTKQSA